MIAGGKNNLIGISGKIGSGKDTVGKILQLIASNGDLGVYKTDLDFLGGGDYILEKCSNYQTKKFAGKLKDIACLLIGCDREQLEDREFKEKELGKEWSKELWYCVADDGSYVPYEQNLHEYKVVDIVKLTPRKLLQLLGTEAGRQIIHPNIWVNALFVDYKPTGDNLLEGEVRKVREEDLIYPNWIITDVRFPNEAQAIKDRGGIVIRVNRPLERLGNSKLPKLKHTSISQHPSETALDNYNFDYVIENEGNIDELVQKINQLKLV